MGAHGWCGQRVWAGAQHRGGSWAWTATYEWDPLVLVEAWDERRRHRRVHGADALLGLEPLRARLGGRACDRLLVRLGDGLCPEGKAAFLRGLLLRALGAAAQPSRALQEAVRLLDLRQALVA